MRSLLIVLFFTLPVIFSHAQEPDFPFGNVTLADLQRKTYPIDTTASAVILDEFGEAHIENGGEFNLIFEYHIKIKILKRKGLEKAEVEIPLYSSDGQREKLLEVKASSFNLMNGSIKESELGVKNVFKEDLNKFWSLQKFAIPNVQVGSVIEYQYRIEYPTSINSVVGNFKLTFQN
jgi:hypothetical protein